MAISPGPCSVCSKPSPDGRYCAGCIKHAYAEVFGHGTDPRCAACGKSNGTWICKPCRKDEVNEAWQATSRNELVQSPGYVEAGSPESSRNAKLHPFGFKELPSRKPLRKERWRVFGGAGTSYARPKARAIMSHYMAGIPQRDIARMVGVNKSYVQRVIKEWNQREYNNPKDKAIASKTAKRTTEKRILVAARIKDSADGRKARRHRTRLEKLLGPAPPARPPVHDDATMQVILAALKSGKSAKQTSQELNVSLSAVEVAQAYLHHFDPEYFF